jgi:arginyl-tRNA synthetase
MSILSHQIAAVVRAGVAAAQAAGALPAMEIPAFKIDRAKNPKFGDYATSLALQIQKQAGKPPLAVAEAIKAHLPASPMFSETSVTAPGFVNFRLAGDWLAAYLENVAAAGDGAFIESTYAGKTAQVEYVSANPTGPLSVHRVRGGVLGDSLANLLAAAGYQVTCEYYFNDAGEQMNNLGASIRARYRNLLGHPDPLPANGYKGLYIRMIAATIVAFQGSALVDASVDAFRKIGAAAIIERIKHSLARVNINHDVFFNESTLYESNAVAETVATLRERGQAYDKEGAVWFASTNFGDEKDRVIIKQSGAPTYRLPDMAYHKNKLDRGFDVVVDIFGADHAATAPQVLMGVRALGYDPATIRVLIHQMVELVEGGEARRMSTRRGDFVELDELIDDVGADAVRYFMLAQNPNTQMSFDLELAKAQGDENPVYRIQNAHVRCAGILRKASEAGLTDEGADMRVLGEDELNLARKISEIPDMIDRAVAELAPQSLAAFALDLAGAFHPVYDKVRVLSDQEAVPAHIQKARLRFYGACKVAFGRLLALMGMSAPETMERRAAKPEGEAEE